MFNVPVIIGTKKKVSCILFKFYKLCFYYLGTMREFVVIVSITGSRGCKHNVVSGFTPGPTFRRIVMG